MEVPDGRTDKGRFLEYLLGDALNGKVEWREFEEAGMQRFAFTVVVIYITCHPNLVHRLSLLSFCSHAMQLLCAAERQQN